MYYCLFMYMNTLSSCSFIFVPKCLGPKCPNTTCNCNRQGRMFTAISKRLEEKICYRFRKNVAL